MKTILLASPLAALLVCACAASGPSGESPEPSATAESNAAPISEPPAAAPEITATVTATAAPVSAAPGVERVAPTLKGKLAGRDFQASSACVAGSTKPGRVYIEIYDAKGDAKERCGSLPADKGALKLGLDLEWTAGHKLDVASLKPSGKEPSPLFLMERVNDKKVERKDAGKELKPTGTIEVLKVAGKDGVGRIKLSITTGKDKLEGEVDVEVKAEIAK